MLESGGQFGLLHHGIVALLGFGGRDISDRLEKPSVVEPVDPFQGCELDGFEGPPWPAPMDQLRLVKPVDRLGEGIIVTVANTAH